MSNDDLVARALAYAASGWAVVTLQPASKRPLKRSKGVRAATALAWRVRQSWHRHPDANIGIATGSVSGIVVVDIDGLEGEQSWLELLDGRPEPPTRQTRTARGRHVHFTIPTGFVAHTVKRTKLDLKGDGGYVLAPPSIHPCGVIYVWIDDTTAIAPAPPELLAAMATPRPTPDATAATRRPTGRGYGPAALSGIAADLANTPEGNRDNRACWSYWRCGKLVGSGLLDQSEALDALEKAVWANGLRSAGIKMHSFEKGIVDAAHDPVVPRRHTPVEQELVPVGPQRDTNQPPTTPVLLEGELGQTPGHRLLMSPLARDLQSTARLSCRRRFHSLFRTRTGAFLSGFNSCDSRSCEGCHNRLLIDIAETIASICRCDEQIYAYENISNGTWSRIRKAIGRRHGGYLRIPLPNLRQTVWSDVDTGPGVPMDHETFEHDLAEAWPKLTLDVAGHLRLEGRWKRAGWNLEAKLTLVGHVDPSALKAVIEVLEGSSKPTATGWLRTVVPDDRVDEFVRVMTPPEADGTWYRTTA